MLAIGAGGGDAEALRDCARAAREEAGVDGALAELYLVTEHPDFASSSTGQVRIFQSTLVISIIEFREVGGVWRRLDCQNLASNLSGNHNQVVALLGTKTRY